MQAHFIVRDFKRHLKVFTIIFTMFAGVAHASDPVAQDFSLGSHIIETPILGIGSGFVNAGNQSNWNYMPEQRLEPRDGYALTGLEIRQAEDKRPCHITATFSRLSERKDGSPDREILEANYCGSRSDVRSGSSGLLSTDDNQPGYINGLGLCQSKGATAKDKSIKGLRSYRAKTKRDPSNPVVSTGFEKNPHEDIFSDAGSFCESPTHWVGSAKVNGTVMPEGVRCSGFKGGDALVSGLIVEYSIEKLKKSISGVRLICRAVSYKDVETIKADTVDQPVFVEPPLDFSEAELLAIRTNAKSMLMLSKKLRACEPYKQGFDHTLVDTNEHREVVGQVDGKCKYEETVPGFDDNFEPAPKLMTCLYSKGNQTAGADMYKYHAEKDLADLDSMINGTDPKQLPEPEYRIDGDIVTNPLEAMMDKNYCTLSKI